MATGFLFTNAVQKMACPKCGASSGYPCATPKGRRAKFPHTERIAKYQEAIGIDEFKRSHSVALVRATRIALDEGA
jgi:hypothetical protein